MQRRVLPAMRRQITKTKLLLMAVAVLCVASCRSSRSGPQGEIALNGRRCHFWAKLTSSMSTKTSKPGDPVTAVVMVHDTMQGGRLKGEVEVSEKAVLRFSFRTLTFEGQTYRIRNYMMSITNSKGLMGCDDLGQRVRVDGDGGGFIAYGDSTALDEGAEIKFAAWGE